MKECPVCKSKNVEYIRFGGGKPFYEKDNTPANIYGCQECGNVFLDL